MTRTDYQNFYLALGFLATYLKVPAAPHLAEPASLIARHIETYCRENSENAFPPVEVRFVTDTDTASTDNEIAKLLVEYKRIRHATLPLDIDDLRALHLRLQTRKMLKMQSMFYATVNGDFLAKAIKKYLKEEIEETKEA